MIRWMVSGVCLLALLAMAQASLAQEFSADVLNRNADSAGLKKLYSGNDKVRFEVAGKSSAMGPNAIILDEKQRKYIVLIAERHMYMDAPLTMVKALITQFWRVQDVDDACPQWKAAAAQADATKTWGRCTRVGGDTVNGRPAVKYEGVSSNGEKSQIWVDTKLHCVVKTEDSSGGGIELRNIQEGSQPAGLFEVPPGYTRLDMGMMKQR